MQELAEPGRWKRQQDCTCKNTSTILVTDIPIEAIRNCANMLRTTSLADLAAVKAFLERVTK